jgi:hypothetical protein
VLPTIDQPLTRPRATDEQATPELSVIIPTFNEAPNIPLVVARLTQALSGILSTTTVPTGPQPWLAISRA